MINLIRAPFYGDEFVVPLGLVSLASAVERTHGAVITDLCLHLERGEIDLSEAGYRKAAQLIMAKGIRLLGFSSLCNSYPAALSIAQECKRLDPACTIIFGGPQASVVDRETLAAFPCVDIIVRGEGEETLQELMTALQQGKGLDSVAGITFRAENGEILATEDRLAIKTLDELPFPNFWLVPDLPDYFNRQEVKEAAIEAGRGCPYACTFCSTSEFFSRRYRIKSPQRILAEMRWFADNLGITNFTLHHDNFNAAKPKVLEFCQVMREAGAPFTWRCSSRTDNISAEMAEIMAQAGCRSVFFGIESGSPAVQQMMKKRLDVSTAREMVAVCLQNGITPTCSFIVGFPEETEDDLNLTLSLALECRLLGTPSIQLHPMSPLPGTELTRTNQYPLQFRPEAVRVHDASPAGAVTAEELAMIRSHPRIFSSFYIIEPVHMPVDLVYLASSTLSPTIWHTPLTLYWYMRIASLRPTQVVRQMVEWLPGGALSWQPADVFKALGALVAQTNRLWLAELLRWEVARYRVQEAPPMQPYLQPATGPLEWAPGAELLQVGCDLDAVIQAPDPFAPPPIPEPAEVPSAYLLVRDGPVVRTMRLRPETTRTLVAATMESRGRADKTVRQFLRAGILRPVTTTVRSR
jgi:radical SAM superfamily enzyme YgiQ (UPF0313 family)